MPMTTAEKKARLHRVAPPQAPPFEIVFDGEAISALPGDTVLTAVLSARPALRQSMAANEPRAGFCLMGACQDCWLWLEDGERLRACTSIAKPGMRLSSSPPVCWPPAPSAEPQ